MNSTSLVFVNMMSSSFLIQPIMNKHVSNETDAGEIKGIMAEWQDEKH